jgi:hypothetical protein
MLLYAPMISADGKPLTREQTLQIRQNSSRGLSSDQIAEGVKSNRQARLSEENRQELGSTSNGATNLTATLSKPVAS